MSVPAPLAHGACCSWSLNADYQPDGELPVSSSAIAIKGGQCFSLKSFTVRALLAFCAGPGMVQHAEAWVKGGTL